VGVKLTTLCENTSGALGISAEWGLSILVDTGEAVILLDTGFSDSLIRNARFKEIDLKRVTHVVLSHGHVDHTGGLRSLLQAIRGKVQIIAHPEFRGNKYVSLEAEGGDRYQFIGVPFRREELDNLGASFILSKEPVWLNEHVVTTGEVPMVTAFEQVDQNMYLRTENGFVPDPLVDDQALVVKTTKGLVIILGCAHRGMVNTMLHAREITGEERIYAVLGGTHLIRAGEEQLWETVKKIKEFGVEKLGVSHCTGLMPATVLAREFKDKFFFNNAGTSIEL